jgi:hypothetical protein
MAQPSATQLPSAWRFATATALCFAALASPSISAAATPSPQWSVSAVSQPTNFSPGDSTGSDAYVVTVTNSGGASSSAEEPITITDVLASGLSLHATGASGEDELLASKKVAGAKLSCLLNSCVFTGAVVPDDTLFVRFPVDVSEGAPASLANVVEVSGGGALAARVETPTTISASPAAFGISPGGAATALSTAQAGAHPDLTTSITFNTVKGGGLAGDPKDTVDELPPGFAGDLVDTAACPAINFIQGECPIGTQIGITTVTFTNTGKVTGPQILPVYNLAPGPGDVAKIGFAFGSELFFAADVTVRPGDYGITAAFHNANEGSVEVEKVTLTVWGVPAAPIHDPLRWKSEAGAIGDFGAPSAAPVAPYLTNPTTCTVGLEARFRANSWLSPDQFVTAPMPIGSLFRCDSLGMEPSLTAVATTDKADAPSGLDLNLGIPQTYDNPGGLATSTLKRTVVTLPQGMTVNPSAGAGLGACSEAEYLEEAVQESPQHGCPSNSKLGTVKIRTPSLAEEATGSVFLAEPYKNQFGSLLALYIVARIPDRGVIVRAAGEVKADGTTGRLVTVFDDLPPLPFSSFTFRFNQGATSPLVTPPRCGTYRVEAALIPLAVPSEVLTPEIPTFPISSNCPSEGAPPFAPQVIAGTNNNAGGSYSPLYLRISRKDGEQEITGLSTQLPPGLTGNLSGIPFCSEAQIQAAHGQSGAEAESNPACPQASQIGRSIAEAGVGSVLVQTPGKLFLGGPFQGAPFSVVSVTSAKVGPFDLGTVVVHLPLQIDPHTAQVTIPSGPASQIPHIINGIVIHLRTIRVYIDRERFMLNPTSCNPLSLSASVIGSGADFSSPADDVSANVNNRFQAADCASLRFAPKFAVSTKGSTSKANGASLSVKLTYPAGSLGHDANIKQVKVELPKQLPSRLTTLQKACTAAQFNANPAGCPSASIVGHAKAITPILPVALEGPAYFVSNGGEAFPNLIIVLQGYGVRIDLVGDTFINHAGITSSTFKTVPDQPVTSFELTLPQGKFSALASNLPASAKGSFCGQKLVMPTEFVAQNGAVIHQKTPVTATGCAKRKALSRKQKLAAALKACRKKPKGKRAACAKAARRRFGAAKAKHKKK